MIIQYIPISIYISRLFYCNIIDVVSNNELGARIISPSFIRSTQYNNPISVTVPVFLKMVILSPILNGLVIKYIPAIIFPIRFWAAKPIPITVTAPIDAAMAGSG